MWTNSLLWMWKKVRAFVLKFRIKIIILIILVASVLFSVLYFTRSDAKQSQQTHVATSTPVTAKRDATALTGPPLSKVSALDEDEGKMGPPVSATVAKPVVYSKWWNWGATAVLIVGVPLAFLAVWFGLKKIKKVSAGGLPESWYTNPTVLVALGIITFNLLFSLLYQETWWKEWWGVGYHKLFWTINGGIVAATFFLTFKHGASKLVGLVLLGVIVWNILDTSRKPPDIKGWYKKVFAPSEARAVESIKPVLYQLFWKKSPGFVGGDTHVREEPNKAVIIRKNDVVFDIVTNYYYFGNHQSFLDWNKLKDPEKGDWHRQIPPAHGKWYLKETSKNHFTGEWMDSRYPDQWMPLAMDPIR